MTKQIQLTGIEAHNCTVKAVTIRELQLTKN